MQRSEPRTLEVLNTGFITKNMFRVRLGGSGYDDFPPNQEGGYVKLRFPAGPRSTKQHVRTYTIRRQTAGTIDIDFALHGDGRVTGPATTWALNTRAGDKVSVSGPGPAKPLPAGTGPFLLVGDMTALPAISVNLEALSRSASGSAVIEVQSEDDRQNLEVPANFDIYWVVNPEPGTFPQKLSEAVRSLPLAENLSYAWVACEFGAMKLIREYLRTERGLTPDRCYISSYWKKGFGEDDHRVIKQADLQSSN